VFNYFWETRLIGIAAHTEHTSYSCRPHASTGWSIECCAPRVPTAALLMSKFSTLLAKPLLAWQACSSVQSLLDCWSDLANRGS
jgi:hypothetical protein